MSFLSLIHVVFQTKFVSFQFSIRPKVQIYLRDIQSHLCRHLWYSNSTWKYNFHSELMEQLKRISLYTWKYTIRNTCEERVWIQRLLLELTCEILDPISSQSEFPNSKASHWPACSAENRSGALRSVRWYEILKNDFIERDPDWKPRARARSNVHAIFQPVRGQPRNCGIHLRS